jgi:hypothetical protein
MISEGRFYNAFLAALRLKGVTFVDTRGDVHHKQFSMAVELLMKARIEGDPGAQSVPRTISSSMFTGRFKKLDDALLRAQSGGQVSAPNPYYVTAELTMSEARARQALERFSDEERSLLERMADVFVTAGASTDADVPSQRPHGGTVSA